MKAAESIASLLSGQSLSKKNSEVVFLQLFKNQLDTITSKNLLLLLAKKGETIEEIAGCLSALRKLEVPRKTKFRTLIDTCGTGGDSSGSVNISTLAALVIAGAGGKVAKHGNRSLSSRCGSSDLLEALGVQLEASPSKMLSAIEKTGIGYFHAPFHHPVFSRVQPLRKSLGVRTIFNMLGPLVNPLRLSAQLIGVSSKAHLETFARVLAQNTSTRAFVCHSDNGMDELTTAARALCSWVEKGRIRTFTLDPKSLGFSKADSAHLKGGDPKKNKEIALKLLQGKLSGPIRDTVLLNAGAGLWISGLAKNLKDGILKATKSLDQGNAYLALQKLILISGS